MAEITWYLAVYRIVKRWIPDCSKRFMYGETAHGRGDETLFSVFRDVGESTVGVFLGAVRLPAMFGSSVLEPHL